MYLRERQFLGKFPPELIAVATQSAKNVYISPDKKRLMYTATQEGNLPPELIPPIPATNTQLENRDLVPGNIYIYDREEDRNFLVGQESENSEIDYKKLLATDLATRTPQTLESSPSAFLSLQASESAQTAANYNRYHTPLCHYLLCPTNEDEKNQGVEGYEVRRPVPLYHSPENKGYFPD